MIRTICVSCHKGLKAPDDWHGRHVSCPNCGGAVVIGAVPEAAPVATEPPPVPPSQPSTKPCRKCGAVVARSLKCPECGAGSPHATPKELRDGAIGLAVMVVLLVVAIVWFANRPPAKPDPITSESHGSVAYWVARDAIRPKLLSPSSAKFPRRALLVTVVDENHIAVRGSVESQNAYGVWLQNEWGAVVSKSASDDGGYLHHWKCDESFFIPPR